MGGLYKGLYPLWARQIPYTMTKFATFEDSVKQIYKVMGREKSSFNKTQQTGVSFLGGYIAGIFCAVVSHPADVMVSKLNADRPREFFPFLYIFSELYGLLTLVPLFSAGESATQAVSRIYKQIGFMGLWNGLFVRIIMLGTLTGFQWMM